MSKNIDFLRATVHRARNQGEKSLQVSTLDLIEVLARIESLEAGQAMQFEGQHVGWCKPDEIVDMRTGRRFFISIRRKKTDRFSHQIFSAPVPEEAQ